MKLKLYRIIDTKPVDETEEEDILDLLNTTPTLKYGIYPRAEYIGETNKTLLKKDGLNILEGGCKAILKTNNELKIVCGFLVIDNNHKYIAS